MLLLGAAESGKSTLSRQIRTLHGNDFSEEEVLHFKHNIRVTCLELLAKHLNEYLDGSSQVSISDDQQNKYSQFLRLVGTPIFQGTVNRKLLDLSIDVWNNSGLQNYISKKLGCKVPRPHGKESADVKGDFTGSGGVSQGRTKDGKLVHAASKANIGTIPEHQDKHGSNGGDGSGNDYRDHEEISVTTETRQEQQCQNSDDPAIHFLPAFSRIMDEGYCPTLQDILSLRIPTTGTVTKHNYYLFYIVQLTWHFHDKSPILVYLQELQKHGLDGRGYQFV